MYYNRALNFHTLLNFKGIQNTPVMFQRKDKTFGSYLIPNSVRCTGSKEYKFIKELTFQFVTPLCPRGVHCRHLASLPAYLLIGDVTSRARPLHFIIKVFSNGQLKPSRYINFNKGVIVLIQRQILNIHAHNFQLHFKDGSTCSYYTCVLDFDHFISQCGHKADDL